MSSDERIGTRQPRVTPIRRVAAALRASPVLQGAAYMYGSTVTTSLLGFVFWFVAAKLLTPAAVGRASAALSASQLVATVGILGLGTLAIAELSGETAQVRRLLSAACVVAGVASALVGLVTGVVLSHSSRHLAPVLGGGVALASFTLLAGTSAAALVVDDASLGLLRGDIQLHRNTVFAAGKLLLLPLAGYVWDSDSGEPIIGVWLIATIVSFALSLWLVERVPADPSWRPDFANLVAKRGLIWSHHLLNVAVWAPRFVPPMVVAALVGPAANAGFYTALFITGFVAVIPGQLSLALFAIKPGDEETLAREARRTMRLCVVLSVATGLLFLFASHPILYLFRRSYVSATPAMALLGLSTFPLAVKAHYVAIARIQGRMRKAARLVIVGAVMEVAGVVAGAWLGKLTGGAAGLLAAYVAESFVYAPTVVTALRGGEGSAA
jgi:O-antigen/teichoic acid export membrane protein